MAKNTRKKDRFSKKELSLFVLIFALVGSIIYWVSFAAGIAGTLTLNTASPTYGSTIGFNYSVTGGKLPNKSVPLISVVCKQNGSEVYLDTAVASDNHQFTLSSSQWTGGSADCLAQLYYYTWTGHRETGVVVLNNISFTAN